MLNVIILSPPVPHTSMSVVLHFGDILVANFCITSNIASSSSSVSPLMARFFKKLAVSSSDIFPPRISFMVFDISSYDRLDLFSNFVVNSVIIFGSSSKSY